MIAGFLEQRPDDEPAAAALDPIMPIDPQRELALPF
jgi:hypothetical protein